MVQKSNNDEISNEFLSDAGNIIEQCRHEAYSSINTSLLRRNWLLGKRISEEILSKGNKENYGNRLIDGLSEVLTNRYGKGFDRRNLYFYTQFYEMFPEIVNALSSQSVRLTWTHYRILLRIHDKTVREWYAKEASEQSWSARTLDRNVASQYYHRLLSSQNKQSIVNEMNTLTEEYQKDKLEFIKNPIVAEFLGLSQNTDFTESEMETSIITNLQKFLMEMGKGYAFVARQQHIRTETDDYFIDLVFYNYILKCFVLIDLKTSKITHQDIGQMDMYVRIYDELKRSDDDNPTLGIILCSETDCDVAKYSILNGSEQLFATKYKLYLPKEEELRAEIEAQKAIFELQHVKE